MSYLYLLCVYLRRCFRLTASFDSYAMPSVFINLAYLSCMSATCDRSLPELSLTLASDRSFSIIFASSVLPESCAISNAVFMALTAGIELSIALLIELTPANPATMTPAMASLLPHSLIPSSNSASLNLW